MSLTRRNCLKTISCASAATISLSLMPGKSFAASPVSFIGTNSGYTAAGLPAFAKWFNNAPAFSGFAFNLTPTGTALSSSIAFICSLGAAATQLGSKVIWSVPFPAQRSLEKVIAGQYDALYISVFKSILAASPANAAQIFVRLPWEFNITSGGWLNAALDSNGAPSPTKFVAAWTHIASLARSVSSRFYRIWCPDVTTRQVDPQACWPGSQYVEIISQDFYMSAASVQPSAVSWYMTEARGLKWAAGFAAAQNKPYGLTEFGMDNDAFAGDLSLVALWLQGLGNVHHACWWDRTDDINCKLSDGTHPGLGAQFKQSFA